MKDRDRDMTECPRCGRKGTYVALSIVDKKFACVYCGFEDVIEG